jgi:hypothetical protein
MWQAWDIRNAWRISVGNHEGKRLLGRPRRRWKSTAKTEGNVLKY